MGLCVISGPDAGELNSRLLLNRSLADDVDDYNGIDESGRFLDISIATAQQGYPAYRVTVAVRCEDHHGQYASDSKHILLTIFGPENSRLEFSVFRGDF